MKLTSAKLKQLILETMNEELLKEEAKGPSDLPDDVYVRVFEWQRRIFVMFTDKDGSQLYPSDMDTGEDNPVWGDVSFFEEDPDRRPCDGASVIAVTEVADGWGPFLYDIAMEIATIRTKGLTPDRWTVSYDAQDVWDFYNKRRPDVESHQLDNEYNDLTPEESDNCGQNQARERSEDYGGEWNDKDNPLSKRYTKPPTVLNQIRDKLIWEL
jgi:hypothetical protein